MLKRKPLLAAGALLATAGASLFAARLAAPRTPNAFEELSMTLRVDGGDEDIGIRIAMEVAEAFLGVDVYDPFGETLFSVRADPAGLGLTELMVEAKQEDVQAGLGMFPPGLYTVSGVGMDGTRFSDEVELSHSLPVRPRILSPLDQSIVEADAMEILWGPVADVDHWVLVVEGEELELRLELPAHVQAFQIPSSLLDGGQGYEVDLAAVNEDGNSVITEIQVRTAQ